MFLHTDWQDVKSTSLTYFVPCFSLLIMLACPTRKEIRKNCPHTFVILWFFPIQTIRISRYRLQGLAVPLQHVLANFHLCSPCISLMHATATLEWACEYYYGVLFFRLSGVFLPFHSVIRAIRHTCSFKSKDAKARTVGVVNFTARIVLRLQAFNKKKK